MFQKNCVFSHNFSLTAGVEKVWIFLRAIYFQGNMMVYDAYNHSNSFELCVSKANLWCMLLFITMANNMTEPPALFCISSSIFVSLEQKKRYRKKTFLFAHLPFSSLILWTLDDRVCRCDCNAEILHSLSIKFKVYYWT